MSDTTDIPEDVRKLAREIADAWGNDREDVTTAQLAERAILADRSRQSGKVEELTRAIEAADRPTQTPDDHITEAMMAAGVTVLEDAGLLDGPRAVGKHVVAEIFVAMREAQCRGS